MRATGMKNTHDKEKHPGILYYSIFIEIIGTSGHITWSQVLFVGGGHQKYLKVFQ